MAPTLPFRLRARLWLRSAILPDLSKWAELETLLMWYTPRRTCAAWRRYEAAEILAAIDQHLAGCRRMRGRRCLRRGLLALYFLRLAGHPAVLHFGVFNRPQGRALAHAWTSVGALVDDAPQADCVPLLEWRGVRALASRSAPEAAIGPGGRDARRPCEVSTPVRLAAA